MIISAGKDDFINNTFDKYRWSANTYETSEEIHSCFHDLGIGNRHNDPLFAWIMERHCGGHFKKGWDHYAGRSRMPTI